MLIPAIRQATVFSIVLAQMVEESDYSATMKHLRYGGLSAEEQQAALENIIRSEPVLLGLLSDLRAFDLPNWLLVSGAIYNNVWNFLTGRAWMTGVKDFDVFYFDDADLSNGAEDKVIKQAEKRFAQIPVPVEMRNQARVHLWYGEKFRQEFSPLTSSAEMLSRFASKTHAVGVRLEMDDIISIVAPFGLDDIFSFRIVPNYVLDNGATHTAKAKRAKRIWPELVVEHWQVTNGQNTVKQEIK